jgi:outer membrane receptor protein involved in Fe transport
LFDGHRITPSSAAGTANIDVLPQMLLQRVDVVTGGASAVYGSDAITGVVNFILDKNFNGIKFDANAGIAQSGVGFNHQAGIAAGTPFAGGRGHVEGSMRYFTSNEVPRVDTFAGEDVFMSPGAGTVANPITLIRDGRFAARTWGGRISTCTPACGALLGQTFDDGGRLRPYVPGVLTGTNNTEIGGDGSWARVTSGLAKLVSNEGFGRISYDLTDNVNAYVQVAATSSINENYHYTKELRPGGQRFFWSNAFLAAAGIGTAQPAGSTFELGKQFDNLPRDMQQITRSVTKFYQVNTGLTGTIGAFDWDVFYTHGESHLTVFALNNVDNAKLNAANDAVINPANGQIVCQVSLTANAGLYPGCIPLNPFGYNATSQEMARYITTDTWHRQINKLDNFGGSVAGQVFELPAGPLRGAVTAEWRKLTYEVDSDYLPSDVVNCTGLRLCAANTPRYWLNTVAETDQSQSVWEVSGELDVPILKDMPFVESLSLNLAGRHTDYSVSGSVQTWKIGVDYHVNPSIRFRGTTSVDIRAPTLTDLFQPKTQSSSGYTDLHTGVGASTQTVSQGNPNLVPEKARTWTGGIVLTPSFIPGFNMAVDYYRITLQNSIGNLGAGNQQIARLCEDSGGASLYCSLYVRPLPFSDRTPANYPTMILTQGLNAAYNAIRGYDFEMNYRFELESLIQGAPGNISLRVLANHQPSDKTIQFTNAVPTYGQGPTTRVTSSFNYTAGPWRLNVSDRWIDAYERGTAQQIYVNPHVKSFNQVDLQVTRNFTAMGADMGLYVQVDNVFAADPPITGGGNANPGFASAIPGGYPVLGRTFAIGIRGTF